MLIYNLFPTISKDWYEITDNAIKMGFNAVFINPIQIPGQSNSLYSIKDYFRINPNIKYDIEKYINYYKSENITFIADLVISHTAIDNNLTKQYSGWFEKENGNIKNPFCEENGKKVVWKDLAQLNWNNYSEGQYQYFLNVCCFLIDLGFRGFRCDAAYQVPNHLWRRLIRNVKEKNNNIIFLAETLGCSVQQTKDCGSSGFDYIFNSSKWWDLKSSWCINQLNDIVNFKSISFSESHDTQRLFSEFNNINTQKQRYALSAFLSSGTLIPVGYEYGFKNKLNVVGTNNWEDFNIDICDYITNINILFKKDARLSTPGRISFIHSNNQNILILQKETNKGTIKLYLNKDTYNNQQISEFNINLEPGQGLYI